MGQLWWPDLGGVHWVLGQHIGQKMIPTRRGADRNKNGTMGLPEVAGKPPPSCGGGGGSAETEQQLALQPSLEGCGAHTKIPKNITMLGK